MVILPASVRGELLSLAVLAPLLQADLRAPVSDRLFSVDASPQGAGVVEAQVEPGLGRELWRFRYRRRAPPVLGMSPFADGCEGSELGAGPRPETLFGDLSESLVWRPCLAARYKAVRSINIQEKKARLLLHRKLAADRSA